jgi:argininosuccinate synthase
VQIYQGYWLDLCTTSALAALEPITRLATGTITVRMYKGDLYFETAEDTPEAMPHSLYTDDSSMEAMGSYDHSDAEGLMRVLGISAKNVGHKQFPSLGR